MSSHRNRRARLKVCFAIVVPLALATTLFALAGCHGLGKCEGGNPVPGLASITPSTIDSTLLPVTINLNGGHFLPSSNVYINGQTVSAEYVSSSQLAVAITGSTLYYSGITAGSTVAVYVQNPPSSMSGAFAGIAGCSDGGSSGSISLRVN